MKNYLAALLIAGVLFAACDKDESEEPTATDTINNQDQDFVQKASLANFAVIDFGQLAITNGSAGIDSFGSKMVTDYTDLNQRLGVLATSYGLSSSDSLDAEHATLKEVLTSQTGRSFDSMYIKSLANDHQKTIDLFNAEISGGASQNLKTYATTFLPKIQEHKRLTDSIAALY